MTDRSEEYSPDDRVQFHVTHTNEHPGTGGWDDSTGMFTCPVPGFYMFAATLTKGNSAGGMYNHQATLRTSSQGDVAMLYNYQGSDTSSRFGSSMFAIVHCGAEERVWVRVYSISTVIIDYNQMGSNQFMGLLLRKDLP